MLLFGVPQESFSGHLLFNIFICDLFIMIDEINIAKLADDNTQFLSDDTPLYIKSVEIKSVIKSVENATKNFFELFTNNHMKGNHDKSDLLMSTLTSISF